MTNVKKSLKKLGALALCLCLALALLPTAAFADSMTFKVQLFAQSGEGTVSVNGTTVQQSTSIYTEVTTETGKLTFTFTPGDGYYYCLCSCINHPDEVSSDNVISGTTRTVEIDVSQVPLNDYNERVLQIGVAFLEYVSVTGTVKDADGNAASGASIVFTDTSDNTYTATTGDDGSYTVSLPQCDCDYVVTSSDGLQKATGTVTVESTTEKLDEITMEVAAYTVGLRNSAYTDGGTVTVGGTQITTSSAATVEKDSTVTLKFTPDEGYYLLGYAVGTSSSLGTPVYLYSKDAVEKEITVTNNVVVTVAFKEYVTVSGTVTAGGSATPALPATITFTIERGDDTTKDYTVKTDASGKYSIDEVVQGTCTSYKVTSDNGLQYAESTESFTLSEDYTLDITMTNTTTGDEVVSARSTANTKIDEAATDAKTAIDNMENLTDDEKTAQKAAVDDAATTAKANIAAATTVNAVNDAETAGKTAISEVQTAAKAQADLNKAKSDANTKIDEAATAAKAAIDAMENLTDDEKTAQKAAVDEAVTTAKANIAAADTTDAVTDAQTNGESAITKVQTEAAKADAVNKIDADVKAAEEAIDALTSLSNEEKQEYKEAIETAATTAKAAVDGATDENGIKSATDTLTSDLKTIKEKSEEQNIKNKKLQDAKDTATEQIESDAQAAKDAIDALDNLTNDEKTALKAKVDEAAQAAKDAVDAAKDQDAVADAKTALTEDLAEIEDKAEAQDLADAKANALAQIESDAQAAKDAIDALENLTDAEKQAAKDAIDDAADAAKDAVNAAETTDGVKSALDALDTSLSDTESDAEAQDEANAEAAAAEKALEEAKAKALAQIESDAQAAKDAIDALENLTDDEKDALKAEVDEAAQAAKDAVDAAETTDGVKSALDALDTSLSDTESDAEAQDEAAAVEQSAEDFIAKYLTDKDGNVYTEATSKNYSDILSGLAAWNALTQAEKDAINAKLTANGGVSYEQLLTGAQTAKKNAEASKGGNNGKGAAPRTSDDTPIALYAVLAIVCAAGLGITAVATKKRKTQR